MKKLLIFLVLVNIIGLMSSSAQTNTLSENDLFMMVNNKNGTSLIVEKDTVDNSMVEVKDEMYMNWVEHVKFYSDVVLKRKKMNGFLRMESWMFELNTWQINTKSSINL